MNGRSFHPADLALTDEHELALTAPLADDPEVAETFNVWLYDGEKNVGFNIHPRATGGEMDSSITVFLPDGRILRANHGSPGRFASPDRPQSAHVKLHCVEPFKRWTISVEDAPVWVTSEGEQAAGGVGDMTPTAQVSFEATITPAAPVWVNGALLPESRQTLGDQVSWWFGNRLTSGFSPRAFRYDQLIEGDGEIRFEGQILPLRGAGLRGHVRGVRRMPGMIGHTWAEGWSRDGRRGFGVTMFIRQGGGYHHSEGFLAENGRLHAARILALPHLDRDPEHRDHVFELACDALGLVRIQGHDLRAFWWRMQGWGAQAPILYGCERSAPVLMKQAIDRFTWDDGVVGYGLVERSG